MYSSYATILISHNNNLIPVIKVYWYRKYSVKNKSSSFHSHNFLLSIFSLQPTLFPGAFVSNYGRSRVGYQHPEEWDTYTEWSAVDRTLKSTAMINMKYKVSISNDSLSLCVLFLSHFYLFIFKVFL